MPEIDGKDEECAHSDEVAEKIKVLRSLVQSDEDVRNLRQDDVYLLRFLYFCDFDADAAFKLMKEYYNLLLAYPEWFSIKSPLEIKDLLEKRIRVLSPNRDKENRHIYICKIGNLNPSTMPMKDVVCLDQTYLEAIMNERETLEKGLCVIIDLEGYSWKIFRWLTPSNLKVSTKLLDIYPLKQYKLHVVNTSTLVNISIKLIWPFLSKRIKEMVLFHFDDWPSLHEHIDPDCLPPEYGGYSPLDYDSCYKSLYSRDSEIAELLKHHRINT